MSDAPPKPKRKRRLVWLLLGLLLGAAGALFVGGRLALQRVPGGSAAVSFKHLFTAGEIRYTVPEDLLQREVAAVFPITQGVEGMLKLVLSNPRFIPDADPGFLRVEVALEAQIVGGKINERYPGRAVVRTQVRFDRPTNSVVLAKGELAEFAFDGAAAPVADGLRTVLQTELAAGMKDYVVFKMPETDGFWTRQGISLVRDVTIEDRKVVVTAGL